MPFSYCVFLQKGHNNAPWVVKITFSAER